MNSHLNEPIMANFIIKVKIPLTLIIFALNLGKSS